MKQRGFINTSKSRTQAAPKVYKALLTQTGTNAPTATVLENTMGGTPVWSRSDVGTYALTLTGAFPASKVFTQPVFLGDPAANAYFGKFVRTDDDTLTLTTGNPAGVEALDDLLNGSPFLIEIYP